jgi:Avidin family
MKKLLLVICLLFGFSEAAMADQLQAPSLWKNQRGSELKITAVKNGRISGTFTNRDPNYQCVGISYPVTGVTSSGPTTFTVNFVKCRTVTKWNGNVLGLAMSSQWVLTYNGQTQVGYDIFFKFN